ncbi:MAG TPA: hypothetical protein VFO46_25600 [Candidatus Sulfotelmatobacter sp.]|nr:hypothetical protein [Candidatus Sulfotelmatobacter sp.]
MRKFHWLAFVCAFVMFAGFAHAQQFDLGAGGSTLWSFKNTTASVGYLPPPEKGGNYPSVFVQYTNKKHLGFVAEGSFRYHQGFYNGLQPYRPILYDLNAVYAAPHLAKKTTGDFMAGIGAETLLFYNISGGCGLPTGGCRTYINSTHFLLHAGAGVRYYVWRNFFIRPEVHWYIIPNNFEFHSDHVFRVGASVGHTWR